MGDNQLPIVHAAAHADQNDLRFPEGNVGLGHVPNPNMEEVNVSSLWFNSSQRTLLASLLLMA